MQGRGNEPPLCKQTEERNTNYVDLETIKWIEGEWRTSLFWMMGDGEGLSSKFKETMNLILHNLIFWDPFLDMLCFF